MKKETILTYLTESITDFDFDGDMSVNWSKSKHIFEINFTLFAENNELETIEDVDGISSNEPVIGVDDKFVFVDAAHLENVSNEEFLAGLPFDEKKGIPKHVIDAIFTYLRDVLIEGQSDLLDFLNDHDVDVFELHWDEAEFKSVLEEYEGPEEWLAYPKY